MWFIGLLFAKSENLNVDLTYDIKSFSDTSKFLSIKARQFYTQLVLGIINRNVIITVERQAEQISIMKEGMSIEAKHVKRKELHNFVAPHLLKRERKVKCSLSIDILINFINSV